MKHMNIRTIIFDLGGVLLNVGYQHTIDAFKQLGVQDFDKLFTKAEQIGLFDQLDRGEVSPVEFREELRRITGIALSDSDIDTAWNAMLLDLPGKRLALLDRVRKHYRTFLLSNTNAIHYPAYNAFLQEKYGFNSLEDLFEKQYLSFEMGLRKPEPAIFSTVVSDNKLNPSETLFIDDSRQHVEGARAAGLHAFWLDVDTMDVTGLFNENHLLIPESLENL